MPVLKALLSLTLLASFSTQAADHHVIGQTFPIAEPDVLAEIKGRAAQTDWKAIMRRQDPSTFSGFQTATLPLAEQDASFLVDPTYTIIQDISDGKGNILYPKGTQINVYAVRQFSGRTIVVKAKPEHFRWLETVAKPTSLDKVLIAGGSMLDARRAHSKYPIYALSDRIIERFGLRVVPSIVEQEGDQLRVREFLVTPEDEVEVKNLNTSASVGGPNE